MLVLQIYAVLVSAKKHQKYSSKHQVSAADLRSTSFCKEAPKAQFQAPKLAKLALHDDQMKSFCTKSAVCACRMAILLKKRAQCNSSELAL